MSWWTPRDLGNNDCLIRETKLQVMRDALLPELFHFPSEPSNGFFGGDLAT